MADLDLGTQPIGLQRTRRNLIKASAIAASAIFAGVATTSAASAAGSSAASAAGGARPPSNCFLKGTMILTADGDRKIEDLVAGDLLPSLFGGMLPIQWIG